MENFEIRTYGRTELACVISLDLNPQVALAVSCSIGLTIILTSRSN